MKKLRIATIFISMLFVVSIYAQDTVTVDPGYGTLTTAIEESAADNVLELQAGQWYGLDQIIEISETNSGDKFTLVGEQVEGTMPPIVQVGTAEDGTVFGNMFSILTNATFKNIFFANQNVDGRKGGTVFSMGADEIRLRVDNCVIDPVGQSSLVYYSNTEDADIYVTNNKAYRLGTEDDTDGGIMFNERSGGLGVDTLWIQNNTFMNGHMAFQATDHGTTMDNFVFIDHNTFIQHHSQLDWNWDFNEKYYTNNLFFNFNTQPWNKPWGQDVAEGDIYHALVRADTLPSDAEGMYAEEDRVLFVQYNLQTKTQGIQDVVAWGEENDKPEVYQQPLIWSPDGDAGVTYSHVEAPWDSNRVSAMLGLSDAEGYPNFKYGNTLVNVDPEWNESRIYNLQDSMATWTLPMTRWHVWNEIELPDVPSIHWKIDTWNDVPPEEYPQTWPRMDASYSNSEVMTASIGGYPLGDLNSFPEEKEAWEQEKDAIFDHITSLNTDQMVAIGDEVSIPESFDLVGNYPNPFNPSTHIEYQLSHSSEVNLTVYDVLGREVKTLVDNSMQTAGTHVVEWNGVDVNGQQVAAGIYFVRLNVQDNVKTHKMLMIK